MTENQIKYVSYLENKRHNEATELQTNREIAETIRNNMANNAVASLNANTNWRNANTNERAQEIRNFEAVTNRYAAEQNVRIRDYQNYLSMVGLQESARHNLASETEAHRSNIANENLRANSNYIDYLVYKSKDKDYSSRANLNAAKTESQNIMNAIDKSTIGAQIAYKTASATEQIGKAKQSKLAGAVASAQLDQASRLASIDVETKYQQYINEIYKEYQADAQIANTKAQTKKAKSGVLKDIGDFFKSVYHIAVN